MCQDGPHRAAKLKKVFWENVIISSKGVQLLPTDHCWEVSSSAGSWWWASWWRLCPGWSWRCGPAEAPGPAGRTPLTPSRAGIAQRPSTSPSSAQSSPCGRQAAVGQPQVWAPRWETRRPASLGLWRCASAPVCAASVRQSLAATGCRLDPRRGYLHKWPFATVPLAAAQMEWDTPPDSHWLQSRCGFLHYVCRLGHSATPITLTFKSSPA